MRFLLGISGLSFACRLVAFGALLFASPTICFSASIDLTALESNLTVKEGEDYAAAVRGNSWDMKQRRDIGWEEGFDNSSISVTSSGLWKGTYSSSGAYVFPLFPGFRGAANAEGLPGDKSLPMFGITKPIKASKYRQLSFKLKTSSRTAYAIYWSNDRSKEYWPDGTNFAANYDGYYNGAYAYQHSGWTIYSHDMTELSSNFAQHAGAWSGDVFALRLDPSIAGPVGTAVELDWVRLVDPDSAPKIDFTWTSSDLARSNVITLYVDTNNRDYNGYPLKQFAGNTTGPYEFPTATLPPGQYYFYLSVHDKDRNFITRSSYSSRLTINRAPVAYFNSPTPVSGADYATSELGDAWDMSNATDVPNLDRNAWQDVWRQFSYEALTGGIFTAYANPPRYDLGNSETDAQVHLRVEPSKPIQTSKYRYLTYRMKVDPTNYTTISDKVSRGWIARLAYWNNDVLIDYGVTQDLLVYDGWNTYTIDLWKSSVLEQGAMWKSFSHLRHLRLDPLETNIYTHFSIDWVKLSAENKSANDYYDIAFTISDTDNSRFTVSLYRDNDNKGFNGKKIATLTNVKKGKKTYRWNTSSLSAGKRYFIYVSISDGKNTRKFYAPSGIVIGS